MTVAAPTAADSAVSVTAYEALRTHVLAGSNANSCPSGLSVLRRQGLSAWMARPSACSSLARPAARVNTSLVGDHEIDAAIVRVLASMALAGQQGVRV